MAQELFSNNPVTMVLSGGTDAPASGTQETWTVADSSGFPAASSTTSPASQFHVADPDLPGEIITVTNASGNNWTVIRGDESTTPVEHDSGFQVTQVVSAGAFDVFVQTVQMTDAIAVETERAEAAEANLIQLGGDLTGTVSTPTVGKIQGTTIQPPSGQATTYLDGTGNWSTPAGSGSSGMANPMTTAGDTLYGSTSGAPTRLPGNITATRNFLTETGTGSAANAPAWNPIAVTDLPQATTSSAGIIQLGGDLGGSSSLPQVLKIQGTSIAAPTNDATAFLNATGQWSVPAGGGGGGTATIWHDLVETYGADPTGTASSSTALADACAAAVALGTASFGLTVPPGNYLLTQGQALPQNLVLQGAGATGGTPTGEVFLGTTFFIGSGFNPALGYVLGISDQGVTSNGVNGPLLSGFAIWGNAYTAEAVDGISITGPAFTVINGVNVIQMSGNGINTHADTNASPVGADGMTWTNITVDSCKGIGVRLIWPEDGQFDNIYVIGNDGDGWQIAGADNSHFTNCRAEWNGGYGLHLTDITDVVGGVSNTWTWTYTPGYTQFNGFSTDANTMSGVMVDGTWTTGDGAGTGPCVIMFSNLTCRRDGQANTGATGTYAGIEVDYSAVATGSLGLPVYVNGISVQTGGADGGGTGMCPRYGVNATSLGAAPFKLAGTGLVMGYTAASVTSGTVTNFVMATTIDSYAGNNYSYTG